MQMEAGLDTGPVLARQPLPIAADDDAGTLARQARRARRRDDRRGAGAMSRRARARAQPQPAERRDLRAQDRQGRSALDWTRRRRRSSARCAPSIRRRALRRCCDGEPLKIWRARVARRAGRSRATCSTPRDGSSSPAAKVRLRSSELQRAGGKRLAAARVPARPALCARRASRDERACAARRR